MPTGKEMEMASSSENIRKLNDRFRRGDTSVPGHLVFTSGVQQLVENGENDALAELAALIAGFDAFSDDNDPYGEHDFGAFEFKGEKLFFKFDYFAPGLTEASEAPGDPWKSIRVLTVMLASEY